MELAHTPTRQLRELHKLISRELHCRTAHDRARDTAQRRVSLLKSLRPSAWEGVDDFDQAVQDTYRHNSEGLMAIRPQDLLSPAGQRVKYLSMLLGQNWGHLFPGFSTSPTYYVYAHCDPRELAFPGPKSVGGVTPGLPFYIGKGTGDRAWCMKRNQGHGLRLKEVAAAGYTPGQIVHFFARGLTEAESLALEAKLVYFFGTIYEEGRAGCLLNLDACKRPVFAAHMRKVPTRRMRPATAAVEAS